MAPFLVSVPMDRYHQKRHKPCHFNMFMPGRPGQHKRKSVFGSHKKCHTLGICLTQIKHNVRFRIYIEFVR